MEKIGKYEVLEKIGTGGFGVVYKGRDPFIKRHVAIKTCSIESEEIRQRFFREAQIAGNLDHRNITTVYDFGLQDDIAYLVQEFLSGADLEVLIRRRAQRSRGEKLDYLLQIAAGLEYAHRQGVVHRDIKPANIRVLEGGHVKIMDFGIAKLAHEQSHLTRTGTTVGTAAYLAPEQIQGRPVDGRADLFSFGVVAYELLTYHRPFDADTISTLLYQILNVDPKPVAQSLPNCPPKLAEVLQRCLRKDPAERFESFTPLITELEAIRQVWLAGAAHGTSEFTATMGVEDSAASAGERAVPAGEPRASEAPTRLQRSPDEARQPGGPGGQGWLARAAAKASAAPARAGAAAVVALVLIAVVAVVWPRGGLEEIPAPPSEREQGDSLPAPVSPQTPEADPVAQSPEETVEAVEAVEAQEAPDPEPVAPREATRDQEEERRRARVADLVSAGRAELRRGRDREALMAAGEARVLAPDDPSVRQLWDALRREALQRVSDARDRAREAAASELAGDTWREAEARRAAAGEPPFDDPDHAVARLWESAALFERSAREADHERERRLASEPVAPAPEAAEPQAAAPGVMAEEGVLEALDRYRRAAESLDAVAVARVWPEVDRDRLERSYADLESINITFHDCSVEIAEDSATAQCRMEQEVKPRAGRRLSLAQQVGFHFARRDDEWVIESLSGDL